ncbi:ParB N-terminal domain-containing protein [bacterium]|nr:ParB N-terminal domain-containing protein [bacterium]
MSIASYYKLNSQTVSTDKLLLDPNNPRLSLGWDTSKKYPPTEVASAELQLQVYQTVLQGKHRVEKLAQSISTKGFVTGSQPIIVKKLKDQYLVLEGNRRTTAIRYLLKRQHDLTADVLKSIRSIPVEVFEYKPNKKYSEDEVVDILLGTIHIEGPESWGAMEKAYYIYRTYERELVRQTKAKKFSWSTQIANQIAEQYSLSSQELKKIIGIYRVFFSLRKHKYDVKAETYSLLELAISSRASRESIFEYDESKLTMTTAGMEAFNKLCLESNSPITNPVAFRAFNFVAQHGTEHQVRQIVENSKDPFELKSKVRQKQESLSFRNKLEDVINDLEKLQPNQFQETKEEKELIRNLKSIVDLKFAKLIS